jgi:RHS repeat-associated protein
LYQITETAASTNTLTYHYDSRGSTIALTADNGLVVDRFEYSLYATLTYRAGTDDTPFLFNGRFGVQTDNNGLYSMGARFYNPYICRFISADPSGFNGGLNFYAYANGNPVSLIDPFGLGAVEGWGGATATWLQNNVVNPLNSISTSSTYVNFNLYNAASLIGGMADLLRVGQGTSSAMDANNGWDVAIGITQDVGRAAGIATIVGGGLEGAVEHPEAPPVITDSTPASEPVGISGEPLTVATDGVPSNTPTTIAGRDYTGHALDSMQSRGIPPSVVENTIQQGVSSPGNIAGRTVYYDSGNNVSVVVDTGSGRVITVRAGAP